MCRAVRIDLSESERAEVRKWHGAMVPVYASVAFCLLAAVVLSMSQGQRAGEALIATADEPAPSGDSDAGRH